MDLETAAQGLGKKPALLLVDMVCGFTYPESPLGAECDSVIKANQELLKVFRVKNLPIFFTTVVYHNDEQAKVFRSRLPALNIQTPDSQWVKVDPRLDLQVGEAVIEKQWASAFHKTNLDELLRAENVDSLVVTGLTTSGCVRASAVDGLQYDYKVVVARDAVGDRNMEAHAANLFDMQAKYTDVLGNTDILKILNTF